MFPLVLGASSVFTFNNKNVGEEYLINRSYPLILPNNTELEFFGHALLGVEEAAVLDVDGAYYFSILGVKNLYYGNAPADCFLKKDFEDILMFLENYDGILLISKQLINRNVEFDNGGFFTQEVQLILQERYNLVSTQSEGNIYMHFESV